MSATSPTPGRAQNWGPHWFRCICLGVACVFFAIMALDRFRSGFAYRVVPEPILYFAQMTGLFPFSNHNITDYRVEAWVCQEHRFVEVDETPFFPIMAGTKESRLHRTLYFYHNHRPTLHALDAYLTERFSQSYRFAETPIGGIRLLEVLEPIPAPGMEVERYRRKPIMAYPEGSIRLLYHTPPEIRAILCREP